MIRRILSRVRRTDAGCAAVPSDRGESLVELLVSIAILGISVIAILGAVSMTASASGLHRDTASTQNLLHNWAETVSNASYTACASTSTIQAAAPAPALPSGFAASVTTVRYWNGSAFGTSCAAASDLGLQRVTLRIAGGTGVGTAGTLDVIVRKPCVSGC